MSVPRTAFLDRIKAFLTILVIVHHSVITYGASGDWYFKDPARYTGLRADLLSLVTAFNQSFFMGFFFLIAGYFTVPAFERKGVLRFAWDRIRRLGVPTLFFGFVLGPLALALAGKGVSVTALAQWVNWLGKSKFSLGPPWFCYALLLFSLGYAVFKTFFSRLGIVSFHGSENSLSTWLLTALSVGVVAFVLRLVFPVGKNFAGLQLGFFSSYIFLFVIGCAAWRTQALSNLPLATARKMWRIAPWVFLTLPVVALLFNDVLKIGFDMRGGWNLATIFYAFWEPLFAWGMIAYLLHRFDSRHSQASRGWDWLSENAFSAFILHAPIIVALAQLFSASALPVWLRLLLVITLGCLLSFGLAAAYRGVFAMLRRVVFRL